MIDSALLAQIRTNMQTLGFGMPDDVLIQDVTDLTNTSEGYVPTYGTGTHVIGRYSENVTQNLRELEVVEADQIRAVATAVVTIPANTVVKADARLTVTVAESGEVLVLEVSHVVRRSNEFHRVVFCKNVSTPI